MKITLVPSCTGGTSEPQYQFLTSYLLNDCVAIDAGCVGLYGTPQEQVAIRHVFLSHTHIDHMASLPILLENAYEYGSDCVTIYASAEVIDCLRSDVFNTRLWPDFIALSPESPFLKLHTLEPGKPVEVAGLRVTPVAVNHVVPTLGFLVEDDHCGVVFSSDTGPTDELWKVANAAARLNGAFLEVTFPNELDWLAREAKHHTPASFHAEVRKLRKPTKIVVVHLKARYYQEIVAELDALKVPGLVVGRVGETYEF